MKRLYRFRSQLTEEMLSEMVDAIDYAVFEAYESFVYSIDYVEYIGLDGFANSICSLTEAELDRSRAFMDAIYGEGSYSVEDATMEIVFGSHDICCGEEYKEDVIEEMIARHFESYVTKDDILDKISAMGIESLVERDYQILKEP